MHIEPIGSHESDPFQNALYPSNKETYQLYKDDDGHWYVIPSSKEKETGEYFEKLYEYFNGFEDEIEPEEPDWLEEVGGSPSLVKFEKYTIE